MLELLVATAAGLIVLAAGMQAVTLFQGRLAKQQSGLARQQDMRLALELVAQEIHLTGSDALLVLKQDEIEFSANVNALSTTVSAQVAPGQLTIPVEDGRGWPDKKSIQICWYERCETMALARDGQRSALTVTQPVSMVIPVGASVSVRNRVHYYSRKDESGTPRFLRQIDGGASVLVGNIEAARFSYWTGGGRPTAQPLLVRRIVVEMILANPSIKAVREISLRAEN